MAILKRLNTASHENDDEENRISALMFSCRELEGIERFAALQRVATEIADSSLNVGTKLEILHNNLALTISTIDQLTEEQRKTNLFLNEDQLGKINKIVALTESLDKSYSSLMVGLKGANYNLVLHRRLRLLLEQLTFTAFSYMPWSDKLWTRIHSLYISAQNRNSTQFRAKSSDKSIQEPTIERLYVTAVLTGAADPYQLAYREIFNVRKIAGVFGGDVKVDYLNDSLNIVSEKNLILVDRRFDRPNLPRRTSTELDEHNVILDISSCRDKLTERLDDLQRKKNSKDPLFSDANRSVVIAIYRHLLNKWGQPPIREAERTAHSAEYDLIVNYANILEVFFRYQDHSLISAQDIKQCVTGMSIDVSETGLGFRLSPNTDCQFNIGELVAIRERGKEKAAWQLVVVRWLRTGAGGVIEIGTFKVPGQMFPAKLLGVNDFKKSDVQTNRNSARAPQIMPVLATCIENTNAPIGAQILIHRSMDSGSLAHWLSFAGVDRLILSMNSVMSTRDVAIYTCQLSKPRRRPEFDIEPEEKAAFAS